MRKCFSFLYKFAVIVPFFIVSAFGQKSYSDFLNETDEYKKAEIGLELVEFYTRNNVDSLKDISAELFLSGSEEGIELTKVVGDYSLGVYFSRKGRVVEGIEYLKRSLNYFQRKKDQPFWVVRYI